MRTKLDRRLFFVDSSKILHVYGPEERVYKTESTPSRVRSGTKILRDPLTTADQTLWRSVYLSRKVIFNSGQKRVTDKETLSLVSTIFSFYCSSFHRPGTLNCTVTLHRLIIFYKHLEF